MKQMAILYTTHLLETHPLIQVESKKEYVMYGIYKYTQRKENAENNKQNRLERIKYAIDLVSQKITNHLLSKSMKQGNNLFKSTPFKDNTEFKAMVQEATCEGHDYFTYTHESVYRKDDLKTMGYMMAFSLVESTYREMQGEEPDEFYIYTISWNEEEQTADMHVSNWKDYLEESVVEYEESLLEKAN